MGAYITQTLGPSEVTGSGSANTLPVWTGTATLGNSMVSQNAGATIATVAGALALLGAFTITTGGSQRMAVNAGTSSGSTNSFVYVAPAHTNQTASVEAIGTSFSSLTREFATGALATQREYVFASPTYGFVGASTITNAYTAFFTEPTAGTNATITNSWAAGFSGNVEITCGGGSSPTIKLQSLVGGATFASIYLAQATPSSSNYTFAQAGTSLSINAPTGGDIRKRIASTQITSQTRSAFTYTPVVETSGAITAFTYTGAANTNQNLSTEINGVLWTTGTRQWATGAITEQNEFKITSPTYSFVGASTITDASTLRVFAPTAGTNATLTRANSLYLSHLTAASTYFQFYESSTTLARIATGTGMELLCVSGAVYFHLYNARRYSFGINQMSAILVGTSNSVATVIAYTIPANTTQTASTERFGLQYTNAGRQWATGAITTQREYLFNGPAYSFVGASTITNAYSMYVVAPTIGANATITNNWGLGVDGAVNIVPSVALTVGEQKGFNFTGVLHTGQTASTEIIGINWTTTGRQWATGAIATQREWLISAPSYSFVGASTITDAITLQVVAPVASTNATITNKYAINCVGNFLLSGTGGLVSADKVIDVTAGDSATINAPWGRFRKDATGTTFTLTNSLVTANSIIVVEKATTAITGGNVTDVVAGSGSFVVTFTSAPSADCDYNFILAN